MKVAFRLGGMTASFLRVFIYNLSLFGGYRCIPFTTHLYGKLHTFDTPVRVELGSHCRIGANCYLGTSPNGVIIIGDNVSINYSSLIVSFDRIQIGAGTSIAEFVSIRDQEHQMRIGVGVKHQDYRIEPITIGENVWIGRGVFIAPGVSIGNHSVVAANSVVLSDVPSNSLVAGSPAVVKKRFPWNTETNL